MKFESQLLKGIAPVVVLEILSRGPMYGYELSQAIEQQSRSQETCEGQMGVKQIQPKETVLLYHRQGQRRACKTKGPTKRAANRLKSRFQWRTCTSLKKN